MNAQQPRYLLSLFLLILGFVCTHFAAAQVAVTPPKLVVNPHPLSGADPQVRASGLQPGEVVRLHLLRSITRWQPGAESPNSRWVRATVNLHGWAEFAADAAGEVALSRAKPRSGSYREASGLGLAWSAIAQGDARLKGVAPQGMYELPAPKGAYALHLQRGDGLVASASFKPISEADSTEFTVVAPGETGSRLAGVLAAERGARGLPTVIILHGSEGGSLEKAHDAAAFYAARGFAAFGLVYFARSFEGVKGVTTDHVEIPLSLLDEARVWLAARPEVDASNIGLFGVSKGAEFALLGAAAYPNWVKSVVACVPSDVVWEGYAEANLSAGKSSWQHEGKPLPFIPLYAYAPQTYRDNTERYSNSRRDKPEAAKAARIPLENITANMLLIGGDRDEVWASGDMSRSIANTLEKTKRKTITKLLTFPTAGHMICGNPDFPIEAYGKQSTDPSFKVLVDEGAATEQASIATLEFFRGTLR